ncbi:MAG: hypothetical protein H0U21_05745 [Acidimicrobiia bacterium]|nr:hypothetical protein [Acidimicrobiia bacterium]
MLAYLDGATGAMLVSAFAGGAAGVGVLFRMYGHRFLGIFSKKHRVQADEAQALLLADAASREHDDESDVSADAR